MRKCKFYIMIIPIMLLLVLSSCNNTSRYKGYQSPLKDIYFGITTDKVIEIYELSSQSFIYPEGLTHTKCLYLNDNMVLGQEGNVILSFFNFETGDLNNRLYSITIEYSDFDIDELLKNLEKKYGKYTASENNEVYIWQKASISSLPDKTVNKMKDIEASCYNSLTKTQLYYVDLAYDKSKDTPLSSIRLIITKSTNEAAKATLVINGKYSLLADLADNQD